MNKASQDDTAERPSEIVLDAHIGSLRHACDGVEACVDYSIVIPVYFNEASLWPTIQSIERDVFAANPTRTKEVIFVDDGSGDGSLRELMEIRAKYPGIIKVVKLTRNFGQVNAVMAGLSLVRGRCAIIVSADGQDPPELMNEMLKLHLEGGSEIVACKRDDRDESLYRVLTSRFFYMMMRRLSFPNMPEGGFDFVLIGRRALDGLLKNQEAHSFIQGQLLWTGFPISFIGYHRRKREVGRSRWTFGKKITYLIDGVISYSFLPIRLMSTLGLLIAVTGFLYATVILVNKLVWGHSIEGWSALMIVILVGFGFQLTMLGIIGEYVWRTLAQVRNRDSYIIEEVHQ